MEALFLQILNMSTSASWLIIAVILIRLLMQKAPKGFRYVLWALVGIRLLCPVYMESDFSLIPNQDVIADAGEAIKPIFPVQPSVPDKNDTVTNDTVQNNVQNNTVQNQQSQNTTGSNDTVQNNTTQNNTVQNNASNNITTESSTTITPAVVMPWIWLGGILALLMYAIVSYMQLRNTIKTAIQREDNLWICDGIQSPFILGLIRPQIYLPSYIEEHHFPYIVAHENEHIRCKDNWWKPLGFVLLTIHWFNPLVWVAYILMCRDIELACDERVIRSMGAEDKKNYSNSLLLCSNPRHFISACPVAFGEVGVKERIKKIVDYRKPSVWIIGIGIVVCIIVAICFMTNPKQDDVINNTEDKNNTEEISTDNNSSEFGEELSDLKENLDLQELIRYFQTDYFNDNENRMPNMFLFTEYTDAYKIDLGHVFNDGADGLGGGEISEQEKKLLAQRYNVPIELDVKRATTQQMNEVLQQYMNISLEHTPKVGLDHMYYLEEYDAYYKVSGDTEYSRCEITSAWKNEYGMIVLQYKDALGSIDTEYQVTLREENGKYFFISNICVMDQMKENLLSQEQLDWFETEFFNTEENRIINSFLAAEYRFPEEIDLYELFYCGPDGYGGRGEVSEAEKQLLLNRYYDEIYTDVASTTTNEMNEVLKKYIGLSLEQIQKVGINNLHYLAEYDAYYIMHGDTNFVRCEIESGKVNPDGSITLQYHPFDRINDVYWVTLVERDGNYQFISNHRVVIGE